MIELPNETSAYALDRLTAEIAALKQKVSVLEQLFADLQAQLAAVTAEREEKAAAYIQLEQQWNAVQDACDTLRAQLTAAEGDAVEFARDLLAYTVAPAAEEGWFWDGGLGAAEMAIPYLLERSLIEKHPVREWYCWKEDAALKTKVKR